MAIDANTAVEFFGTQVDLDSTSAAVVDAAFSVVGDLITWTNTDNAVVANIILSANYTVAPDANSSVNLYLRPINIVTTSDQEAPDGNFQHSYVGSFPVNDVTTAQLSSINIALPNVLTAQEYEFYIENVTGQTIPAGWTLYITDKAIGPHA